jgi:hypothetical protein
LTVGPTGTTLMPAQHSVDVRKWVASSAGPVRSGSPFRRQIAGLHPLLAASASGFTVDARFLDLTELWWGTHKDGSGRYLDPVLSGRIEFLRVLGWTGGDLPTIWFAVLNDLAVGSLRQGPERPKTELENQKAQPGTPMPKRGPVDVVWLRPPADLNSFSYAASLKGFEDPRHDTTTWWNLCRWLLSPAPKDKLAVIKGLKDYTQVIDQVEPLPPLKPAGKSADVTARAKAAVGALYFHRPVGLERIQARAARADIILLPLGADTKPGYSAAVRAGLASRVKAATALLWALGASARDDMLPPASGRALWVAAHSGANFSLSAALDANPGDVARVISHDAAGGPLPGLLAAIAKEVKRRGTAPPPLETVFIVTPNLTSVDEGLTQKVKDDIENTGAKVLHLPPFAQRQDFWRIPPIAKDPTKARVKTPGVTATEMIESSSSPFLRYLFENLTEDDMFDAGGKPRFTRHDLMNWVVVHEFAVLAGALDPLGPNPGPDPVRTTRTLLEDSLAPL